MEYRVVMMLVIIINVCYQIDAKLNVIPRDTEVKINDSTYMNCSTSLQADLIQWLHGNNYVYTGIAILEPYNDGRFSVEINASTGASNLVIRSVQTSDAGKYECADDEGTGDRRSVQLIVLDGDPICESNMHSYGVIGPNSCDIKPDEVKLSCSVTYHGNVLPILQWKTGDDNQSTTDGRFNVTSRNYEVTYTLTMKSSLGLNNSSFTCQTTRTFDRNYSCSSDFIKISYVFSREVTINTTMNDEVRCLANTSQSCSYKWKWFSGDDSTTESDNQILKPKKVGWHRCEATCSLGNRSCIVEAMYAEVYSTAATSRHNLFPLLVLLVIPVPIIIGVVLHCWRKSHTEKQEQDQDIQERELQTLINTDPSLVQSIRTKASEEKKKDIWALTILDKELFVISEESSDVEVYDSMIFSLIRRCNVKELIRPLDIASCNINKCLYVFDFKGFGQSHEILRVDPNGKLIMNWSTKDDWGRLSVTNESNVILTVVNKNKLSEYSPVGQLMREIKLSSDAGIENPWHAIQLTNGNFVVCHGRYGYDLHRVCIVDADGKLKMTFGAKRESTTGHMNKPVHLAVDENGFVLVVDRRNIRVLLLDSELELKREILSKEKHGLRRPKGIFLDQSNNQLFVADPADNRQILIFDMKQLI